MSVISQGRLAAFSDLSSLQFQVDHLVGGFADTATDWRALAAMTAGGLAYRAGRIGLLDLGKGSVLRAASVGLGLSAEVSAFELTHRSLESFNPLGNSNLWRWNGSGGLSQGLAQSFIAFGALKGAGGLVQGENVLAQHLLQDSAVVLGHQAGAALGLAPKPHASLAEQFLHAEATNLQIGAGMALAPGLAPGIHGLERGLNLSLRSFDPTISPAYETGGVRSALFFEPALASAAPKIGGQDLRVAEENSSLVFMSEKKPLPAKGNGGASAKKGPTPVVERFSRSTEILPMDLSGSLQKIYDRFQGLLRESPMRPLAVFAQGETDPIRAVSRLRHYLDERHGQKLIPQEFALAVLDPGQEKGWVIYPHGLEIRSEIASTELLKRLRRLKEAAGSSKTSAAASAPGVFSYQGRPYRIEGMPSEALFKQASEPSPDAMEECLEAIRHHLRGSVNQSLVFSFGLNHADPLDMRVKVLNLLQEKDLPPGPIIAVALVNDAQAFLFEKKGIQIQVYRASIEMLKGEGSEGSRKSSTSSAKLPQADTVPQIFEHFRAALNDGRSPEVTFTGKIGNPATLGQFAKWLQQPSTRLAKDQIAIIQMPQMVFAKTGTQGQMIIFSWHSENQVGWVVDGLPEEPTR